MPQTDEPIPASPALPDTPTPPGRRRRTRTQSAVATQTAVAAAAVATTTAAATDLTSLAIYVGAQGSDITMLKSAMRENTAAITGLQRDQASMHRDVDRLMGVFEQVNLPQMALDLGQIKTDNQQQTINTQKAREASVAAKRALSGKVWVGVWTLVSGGMLTLGLSIVSHQSLLVECIALGAILTVGLVLGLVYYLTHRG